MVDGLFKYEDDLLKHHIRTDGWLPVCRNRLDLIRAGPTRRERERRLRYFTFCAVGAIDVLMLDVANIVRQSSDHRFDTVFFFDHTPEYVIETQKRIPGAIGFPGEFTQVVLCDDPAEDLIADSEAPLDPSINSPDIRETRANKLLLSQHREFIQCFPFDVINLDLEEFLLKPNDPFPGRLIQALRKVFAWQRRPLQIPKGPSRSLAGFSLMFTTRIGPPNLTEEYLGMLRNSLTNNIRNDGALEPLLVARTGLPDVVAIQENQFETFFKLGMPKVLAAILMEEDWYIDHQRGIRTYEIERTGNGHPFRMLHLVMDVLRHNPAKEHRAPGTQSDEAQDAYREIVRQVFATPEILVTLDNIETVQLQEDLDRIKARRKLYYDPETEDGE